MRIISDDIVKLNKLYEILEEEELNVKKLPIDDDSKDIVDFIIQVTANINIDVKLNITASLTEIILGIVLVYQGIKKLLLKKPSGEEEVIDVEILENPKSIENQKKLALLDIPEGTIIEIIE